MAGLGIESLYKSLLTFRNDSENLCSYHIKPGCSEMHKIMTQKWFRAGCVYGSLL